MKRLPPKLRIGGASYKFKKLRKNIESAQFYGQTDWDSRTIHLAKGMAPATLARTIVHEMLHVLLDEAGLNQNERLVLALEAQLSSFIADNHALISWLQEALKK